MIKGKNKSPKKKRFDGKKYRLYKQTLNKIANDSIKKELKYKGYNVRVVDSPKLSKYNYDIYKRKKNKNYYILCIFLSISIIISSIVLSFLFGFKLGFTVFESGG